MKLSKTDSRRDSDARPYTYEANLEGPVRIQGTIKAVTDVMWLNDLDLFPQWRSRAIPELKRGIEEVRATDDRFFTTETSLDMMTAEELQAVEEQSILKKALLDIPMDSAELPPEIEAIELAEGALYFTVRARPDNLLEEPRHIKVCYTGRRFDMVFSLGRQWRGIRRLILVQVNEFDPCESETCEKRARVEMFLARKRSRLMMLLRPAKAELRSLGWSTVLADGTVSTLNWGD